MKTLLKPNWQAYKVSSDETHHIIEKKPAYNNRFMHVLKFHHPGIAPALDATGAFHIDPLGQPIYSHRYTRTFGFYCERAAIDNRGNCFHILPNGSPLYRNCYKWCGNFQENLCSVRDQSDFFFHIDETGARPYSQQYSYVGDFHDGVAVVQVEEGLHFHINPLGERIHPHGFVDLDIFHKGFARAKDSEGWFHINRLGKPIYQEKYALVEPFYNGFARVETKWREILLIDEGGEIIKKVRAATKDPFHDVSGDLVSYWRWFTLKAAHDLNLFDCLPDTLSRIADKTSLSSQMAEKILLGLKEMGYVKQSQEEWKLTTTGSFLSSSDPYSLREAQSLWMMEHFNSWKELLPSLQYKQCAFEKCYQTRWFDFLDKDHEKRKLYHQALSRYAMKDYSELGKKIDFSTYQSVADIGGSTGTLLELLLSKYIHLKGHLLDLPAVINQFTFQTSLRKRIYLHPCDFFKIWPKIKVDAAMLCRILHDWPDEAALHILKHTHALLKKASSRLYVIENILDKQTGNGALLNLNMLVMTGGQERTLDEFNSLFGKAGFSLETQVPLNAVSTILVLRSENMPIHS